MRLGCRAAENLMLSDDVLALAGRNWVDMKTVVSAWVEAYPQHLYKAEMGQFVASDFDRRNFDLKPIRNILIGLMSNKPWEVLVGQAIAALAAEPTEATDGSLRQFLGEKVCTELLKLPPSNECRSTVRATSGVGDSANNASVKQIRESNDKPEEIHAVKRR